jgi:hypothetical protein
MTSCFCWNAISSQAPQLSGSILIPWTTRNPFSFWSHTVVTFSFLNLFSKWTFAASMLVRNFSHTCLLSWSRQAFEPGVCWNSFWACWITSQRWHGSKGLPSLEPMSFCAQHSQPGQFRRLDVLHLTRRNHMKPSTKRMLTTSLLKEWIEFYFHATSFELLLPFICR